MDTGEHVILLHGLCRTARCMHRMASALQSAGYVVHNTSYPSRSASIDTLSEIVGAAASECSRQGSRTIHFVTHSLGGILLRAYLKHHHLPSLGRAVMLSPPNQGSEVVDHLARWKFFHLVNGPAGRELGTGPHSVPNTLGPVAFPLGVIAGNRSINWINSLMIQGPGDGKVSVERTKVAGMSGHIVISTAHPFMMKNREVIRQTLAFLRSGKFVHAGRSN